MPSFSGPRSSAPNVAYRLNVNPEMFRQAGRGNRSFFHSEYR
jgi:hypothetical protein